MKLLQTPTTPLKAEENQQCQHYVLSHIKINDIEINFITGTGFFDIVGILKIFQTPVRGNICLLIDAGFWLLSINCIRLDF